MRCGRRRRGARVGAPGRVARRGNTRRSEAADYQRRVEGAFDRMQKFYDGFNDWFATVDVSSPTADWFDLRLDDFYA